MTEDMEEGLGRQIGGDTVVVDLIDDDEACAGNEGGEKREE